MSSCASATTPIIRAMRAMGQPVIAAVNGVAAGAGASLAFACDLRIARREARFVLAFGRIGLVPDCGATWFLPRLVGRRRAAELALVGDPVGAEEARAIGLVVAGRARGDRCSTRRARWPQRARAARRGRWAGRSTPWTRPGRRPRRGARRGGAAPGPRRRDGDHAEGLAAFREKRPPRFTAAERARRDAAPLAPVARGLLSPAGSWGRVPA